MLMFLVGALVGGAVGVITMCLCIVAGEADRYMETELKNMSADKTKE